jgi:hypothetical protein
MATYHENVEDKKFTDLLENDDFKKDLVRFFSGKRYAMSDEKLDKLGFDGLANEFAEHMRWQDWHDATALKDLNYVNNKQAEVGGKQAFGRLIQAWDNSDGAGTGFVEGAKDIGGALLSSPSTFLGVGTLGLSKLAAKGAQKVTAIAVRQKLRDYLKKNTVIKGALAGAATEGTIGGAQAYGKGETREELIDGYEYTRGNFAGDVALNSTVGLAFGALGGKIDQLLTKDKDALNAQLMKRKAKTEADVKKNVKETLTKKENQEVLKSVLEKTITMVNTLNARRGGAATLDPLDKQQVAMGEAIKSGVLNVDTEADGAFSSGLSLDTIRGIAAATTELAQTTGIKLEEGKRITQVIANKLNSSADDFDPDILDKIDSIRNKYGLTREQFSFIYLAELSEAGKTLAAQSAIVRAKNKLQGKPTKGVAEERRVLADIKDLAAHGLSSIDDVEAANASRNVLINTVKKNGLSKTYNFLQETDQMRIAFMTSQPATTARNVASTGLLAAVDVLDQGFKGLFGGDRNTFKNMFSTIRGLSYGNAEASVLKDMLETEMPDSYRRIFHDTMRMEVGTQSNSAFAKTGRLVNMFNTVTDTAFKEAAFYSSIQRSLLAKGDKKLGTDVREFIKNTGSLDRLSEINAPGYDVDIIRKALDDANRFTMQRTYMGDESLFGKGARAASRINEKVPFLVSGYAGIPFPRYVANHLEMVFDYTPFLPALMKKIESLAVDGKVKYILKDDYKSDADRLARQLTGASLIMSGIVLAHEKKGEIDYKSIENQIRGQDDISSSLGFIVAPIFIGDLIYRAHLAPKELGLSAGSAKENINELGTVLGGLSDMGFDNRGINALIDNIFKEEGVDPKAESDLAKLTGNIFSTFTYPLTPFRDLAGQINYEASGTPYTRPLEIQDFVRTQEAPRGVFKQQATRFMPDYDFLQIGQSFADDPNRDIKYYSILYDQPIASINPLKKTFTGVQASPTLTKLGREFNKLKINERDVYDSGTNANPMIDYGVRKWLSQNLSDLFLTWADNEKHRTLQAGGKTYNELTDPSVKKELLKGFVKARIGDANEMYKQRFTLLRERSPVKAGGYIRNLYHLKIAELGGDQFNAAAKYISDNEILKYDTDKSFNTSAELLSMAETIPQELKFRQVLIHIADMDRSERRQPSLDIGD